MRESLLGQERSPVGQTAPSHHPRGSAAEQGAHRQNSNFCLSFCRARSPTTILQALRAPEATDVSNKTFDPHFGGGGHDCASILLCLKPPSRPPNLWVLRMHMVATQVQMAAQEAQQLDHEARKRMQARKSSVGRTSMDRGGSGQTHQPGLGDLPEVCFASAYTVLGAPVIELRHQQLSTRQHQQLGIRTHSGQHQWRVKQRLFRAWPAPARPGCSSAVQCRACQLCHPAWRPRGLSLPVLPFRKGMGACAARSHRQQARPP